jgi:putative ABC transport system permease protein
VRAADPSGASAMAVVEQPGLNGEPSVLAMDTTRMSVITGWRKEYGGQAEKVAAALRPVAPRPVTVTTDRLVVEASATDPADAPVHLRIRLRATKNGTPVDAVVGPLTGTRRAYSADTRVCAAGCRLVGVQVLGPKQTVGTSGDAGDAEAVGYSPPTAGAQVHLYPTAAADHASLPAALLTEPERWRPAVGPRDLGPTIAAGRGSLHLTVSRPPDGPSLVRNDWAFVADTPVVLPALVAGWAPDPTDETRLVP